ncbi:RNA exonuclease 4 [Archocentrus centrarchus]|uniref:RNA exonuclease 4 n=1 Tax=Archocentrus centrarchus TaxID=63155 RepID=UPI0011EA3EBB|nr:RNA exonuclease 4 [Archocentrus centrarchus]
MSKVEEKKKHFPDKSRKRKPKKKNNILKKNERQWFYAAPANKDQEKAKDQQTAPPKDSQHFSANWKALQEVLKASQTEKQQPTAPKHQNGFMSKNAQENSSKITSKNNAGLSQKDTEKKAKHKTVPKTFVPSETGLNSKFLASSDTRQSAGLKRETDSGKLKSLQAAKKKKLDPEETKPTEEDLWFDDVDPDDIEATVGAEAAEIMRKKQGKTTGTDSTKATENSLVKENAFEGLTKAVAIDCEMVGVGPDGEDSILARVSIVNQFGKCIYDRYVKPTEKVTDYRTAVSGIRPEDIKDGEDVQTVQREVAEILEGRIVVGHAIHNDLKILLLDHPKKKIRDTQKYKPFKTIVKSGRPSLKLLCKKILNVKVQEGEHSSVQDAQATMRLYTLVKKQWEAQIKASKKNKFLDKRSERKPKLPKGKNH